MTRKKPTGRGGARPGAGRPALPSGERLNDYKVRLDAERRAKVERLRLEGETGADVIRRLIDEA